MANRKTSKQSSEEIDNLPEIKKTEIKSESKNGTKKLGFLNTMFIFLFVLSIMMGVSLGTIYYILKNNVNDVAEKNRSSIFKIPVIKYFLPEPKDKNILDDPDNYSDKDLRIKYTEIYKERNELRKTVDELTKGVSEKDKVVLENGQIKKESESLKAQSDNAKKDLEKEKAKFEEDKKKFAEMVARGDKQAFKEYFEKVDKETAKKIYEEVIKQVQVDEGTKSIAKMYEGMDPAASSKILEEMVVTNKAMAVEILKNMNQKVVSQVIAAMKPTTAADLTKEIENSYKPK